jgi:hypothetical protein
MMENNNHFDYSLKVFGLTFLSAPVLHFLIATIFKIDSDFGFNSMVTAIVLFVLLFILALPTFYGVLFFTKKLFKTDTPILLLRFIIFGLSTILFTLNISLWTYLFFSFGIEVILYFKYYYICLAIFIFLAKIERPKFYYKESTDLNILDDDLNFKK